MFIHLMPSNSFAWEIQVFQSPQSNDPEIKVTEVKDTGAKEVTQTTPDNDIEEEPQLVWDGETFETIFYQNIPLNRHSMHYRLQVRYFFIVKSI